MPVQNNGSIYNVIYTFTKGHWILQPYYQYTSVPTNAKIGVVKGASTNGGAILASYAFAHGFSLPVRFEYITSSGNAAQDAVNLLFGPGSTGTSFTATPTFQSGGFFLRGDIGWAHAGSFTQETTFSGPWEKNNNQLRGHGRGRVHLWQQYRKEIVEFEVGLGGGACVTPVSFGARKLLRKLRRVVSSARVNIYLRHGGRDANPMQFPGCSGIGWLIPDDVLIPKRLANLGHRFLRLDGGVRMEVQAAGFIRQEFPAARDLPVVVRGRPAWRSCWGETGRRPWSCRLPSRP